MATAAFRGDWGITFGGGATGNDAAIALEDLPSTPATAGRVSLGGYSITLDPSATVPYAIVGVMVNEQNTSRVHLLRPGDRLNVPRGFKELWVFNALGWLTDPIAAATRTAGRISLSVTTTPDGPYVQYDQRNFAPARAGLAWQGIVTLTNDPAASGYLSIPSDAFIGNVSPVIPLSNVQRMRVVVAPMAAGSAFINGAIPGDFAATLRPYVLMPVHDFAAGPVFTGPVGVHPSTPWKTPDKVVYYWVPHVAGLMTASPTECEFELSVPSGLAMAFRRMTLAGTGVADLFASVEVY
jgi:hypothetical protein